MKPLVNGRRFEGGGGGGWTSGGLHRGLGKREAEGSLADVMHVVAGEKAERGGRACGGLLEALGLFPDIG